MAKAIQLLDDDLLSLLDISALAWNGTLLLINILFIRVVQNGFSF